LPAGSGRTNPDVLAAVVKMVAVPLPVAVPETYVIVPVTEQVGGELGLVTLDEVSAQEFSVTTPV
jgi:hypothetical protein